MSQKENIATITENTPKWGEEYKYSLSGYGTIARCQIYQKWGKQMRKEKGKEKGREFKKNNGLWILDCLLDKKYFSLAI